MRADDIYYIGWCSAQNADPSASFSKNKRPQGRHRSYRRGRDPDYASRSAIAQLQARYFSQRKPGI
jgi:hypothetical protein